MALELSYSYDFYYDCVIWLFYILLFVIYGFDLLYHVVMIHSEVGNL